MERVTAADRQRGTDARMESLLLRSGLTRGSSATSLSQMCRLSWWVPLGGVGESLGLMTSLEDQSVSTAMCGFLFFSFPFLSVRKAMKIAADTCIYTNDNILMEKIE